MERGGGAEMEGGKGKADLLNGFIFLLLRFELLAGGDGGLEVWGFVRLSVYLIRLAKKEGDKGGERTGRVPVCSF